ncbi:MAG: tetratricopeptide repeat protein [Planctomycetota bacterium]
MTDHTPKLKPVGRSPAAQAALAKSLVGTGRLDDAEEAADAALRANPESADAHHAKGLIARARGLLKDARRHLERTVQLDPAHAEAWAGLALTLTESDEPSAAHDALERAMATYEELGEPHPLSIALLRARILKALQKHDEAVAAYRAVLDLEPRHAAAHLELGRLLRSNGLPTTAVEHLTAARSIGRWDPEPCLELGDSWRESGDFDRAMEEYRTAALRRPHDSRAYVRLGELFLDRALHLEALQSFRMASVANAQDARAYLGLGRVYLAVAAHSEAVEAFEQARVADPELTEAVTLLGQAQAARDAAEG